MFCGIFNVKMSSANASGASVAWNYSLIYIEVIIDVIMDGFNTTEPAFCPIQTMLPEDFLFNPN